MRESRSPGKRGDIWRRVYLEDGMINGYLIIGDTRISGYIYQLYISRQRVDRNIRENISPPTRRLLPSDARLRRSLTPQAEAVMN